VEREKGIIGLGFHDGASGSNHLQAHEESKNNPAEKEGKDEDEVKKADPLMV
jgi:hypothetical protein